MVSRYSHQPALLWLSGHCGRKIRSAVRTQVSVGQQGPATRVVLVACQAQLGSVGYGMGPS